MQRTRGFTLIEIAISVFILLIIMTIAVPSLSGVMADRRLRKSLDEMNALVRQAQERSITERRPYLLVWEKEAIALRPESLPNGDEPPAVATLPRNEKHAFGIEFPAALEKDAPAEWVFWPSGTCEPATVRFSGSEGSWKANYAALTARPEITDYATR